MGFRLNKQKTDPKAVRSPEESLQALKDKLTAEELDLLAEVALNRPIMKSQAFAELRKRLT